MYGYTTWHTTILAGKDSKWGRVESEIILCRIGHSVLKGYSTCLAAYWLWMTFTILSCWRLLRSLSSSVLMMITKRWQLRSVLMTGCPLSPDLTVFALVTELYGSIFALMKHGCFIFPCDLYSPLDPVASFIPQPKTRVWLYCALLRLPLTFQFTQYHYALSLWTKNDFLSNLYAKKYV